MIHIFYEIPPKIKTPRCLNYFFWEISAESSRCQKWLIWLWYMYFHSIVKMNFFLDFTSSMVMQAPIFYWIHIFIHCFTIEIGFVYLKTKVNFLRKTLISLREYYAVIDVQKEAFYQYWRVLMVPLHLISNVECNIHVCIFMFIYKISEPSF